MEQASGLEMKRSELDSTQECVPNDESNATLASSLEEDYTGTEELDMDEDSDTQEDSDSDAGESSDLSFDSTTDEDVDSDIGEECGSNTDGYVWDLDAMWKYADENILQLLSDVYEREKSNSDETKRREERALRKARTKVRRLALYTRLVTEVMLVHVTPYSAWFLDVGGFCELTGNIQ